MVATFVSNTASLYPQLHTMGMQAGSAGNKSSHILSCVRVHNENKRGTEKRQAMYSAS